MYVGAESLAPAQVDLTSSAVNFVELDLTTTTSAPDTRAFWDPQANGGDGAEFSQIVDTAKDLTAVITVNQTGFSGGSKIPLMKITMTGSAITALEDARNGFFRLGTGGSTPNPSFNYPWSQGQTEPDADRKLDAGAFLGADKGLNTFKDWADAIMTEIKSIKGSAFWFVNGSSLYSPLNLASLFFDAAASMISGNGKFAHSESVAGELTWTSDFFIKAVIGDLELKIEAATITLSDKQVGYISIVRDVVIAQPFTFTNGSPTVTAAAGAFSSFVVGDWIKAEAANGAAWRQIASFNTGNPVTAISVTLDANYSGATSVENSTRTQGTYTVNLDNGIDVPASGNTYWIAKRDDNGSSPRIYLRGLAELEQGEERDINDNQSDDIIAYIGSAGETDNDPDYLNSIATAIAEITDVTIPDAASITTADRWNINSASDETEYEVVYNKDGGGTGADTDGKTKVIVVVTTGDSDAVVATATAVALNALPDFSVPAPGAAIITVTNAAVGATTDAANVSMGGTFAIAVSTQGVGEVNNVLVDGENLTQGEKRLDIGLGAVQDQVDELAADVVQNNNLELIDGGTWFWDLPNTDLILSADAHIQIPGLTDVRNTILAQTIPLAKAALGAKAAVAAELVPANTTNCALIVLSTFTVPAIKVIEYHKNSLAAIVAGVKSIPKGVVPSLSKIEPVSNSISAPPNFNNKFLTACTSLVWLSFVISEPVTITLCLSVGCSISLNCPKYLFISANAPSRVSLSPPSRVNEEPISTVLPNLLAKIN